MRADVARADRAQEVRDAARGWRRAGAIDEAALASIESAYPDDRVRLGPVFRVLAFLFTALAVLALIGLLALVLEPGHRPWALPLLVGVALVVVTEVQLGPLRRRDGGTETATAWLAFACLVVGLGWYAFDELHLRGLEAWIAFWSIAACLSIAAVVRWGGAGHALVGSVAVFLLLAATDVGRLGWILIAVAAAPVLVRASESKQLPPAQRHAALAALASCLAALYLAVHFGSWESGWVEGLHAGPARPAPPAALRPLALTATAALPVGLLAWSIATRRRVLLRLGLLASAASLVTLRWYVHVAPAWLAMTAAGAAMIALGLAVRRALDAAPGRERWGFTAAPLFGDAARRERLAAAVTLAAGARLRPEVPAAGERFRAGGGSYGGGGATGKY
jgi:hypothetical protein